MPGVEVELEESPLPGVYECVAVSRVRAAVSLLPEGWEDPYGALAGAAVAGDVRVHVLDLDLRRCVASPIRMVAPEVRVMPAKLELGHPRGAVPGGVTGE